GIAVTAGNNPEAVKSGGKDVRHTYEGNAILGYADIDADGIYTAGTDSVVYKITGPDTAGDFTFDLIGRLHHIIGTTNGQGDAELLTLDLSNLIVAKDFDGDVVNLGVRSIRVAVENDIPSLVANDVMPELAVDETNLNANGSVHASNFFDVDY